MKSKIIKKLSINFEKEIVAFLNSHDGYIYLGVEDNGEICGINNLDETLKKISDIIFLICPCRF